MWISLILLVAVVAIVMFVVNFRRQAKAREAASAERMKAFLEQARASADKPIDAAVAAPATGRSANPTAAPADAGAARTATAAPAMTGFIARARMLDPAQTLLYRLLKTALPGYDVFAQVSLAAFIAPAGEVTGFAREAQARRLADAVADFVVCDRTMKVLAAVQCGTRSGKAAEHAAFAAACALSTGVRWVELAPDALPAAQELKQRVLGE